MQRETKLKYYITDEANFDIDFNGETPRVGDIVNLNPRGSGTTDHWKGWKKFVVKEVEHFFMTGLQQTDANGWIHHPEHGTVYPHETRVHLKLIEE